jgi:TolB protein
MNADGTNQTNVTNTPTVPEVDPRWSSDGSKLAFRSNGAQFTEIFVMSADGSGRTQLTNSSSQVVAELHDWSPSGSRLLFARLVGSPLRRDLFVINADGSGETNITNTAVSDFNATWSPDGSRIAFMRSGDIGESSSDVYVANADGSAATKLTSLADIGAFPQIPGWSPDGVRIAFTAKVGPTFTEEIFTIGANGSDLSRLTTNTATDNQLVWSP